jgi:hypothetical protein
MNKCFHAHYCPDCKAQRACDFPECQYLDSARICVGCVGRSYRKPIDQLVEMAE